MPRSRLSGSSRHPCDHANIKGFGFPVRFRLEASDAPDFKSSILFVDRTDADHPNPGAGVQKFDAPANTSARYVRLTATKLMPCADHFLFALHRMAVISGGKNAAAGPRSPLWTASMPTAGPGPP